MLISEIEVLDMDCSDAPQVLRDFLAYHETICGHSKATVDQYYLDLRMFLRAREFALRPYSSSCAFGCLTRSRDR